MSAPLTAEQLLALLPKLDKPPASGCKRYRATVLEWLSWDIIIDAENKAAAEDLAEQLWSEVGGDAFRFRDQGFDGVTVDEIEEGGA